MSKRPTPKKRRSKRATRTQHSIYVWKEMQRLQNRSRSPFGKLAEPKNKGKKALKGLTRIKA